MSYKSFNKFININMKILIYFYFTIFGLKEIIHIILIHLNNQFF